MVLDPHPDLAPAPAPTTSTPTTANTTTVRSFTNPNPQPPSARPISPLPYPQPQHHHQHHLYATAASQAVRATSNHPPQQPHSQGILYPVASSGRGFIPKPPMQTVTVAANPGSASATYTPRTLVSYPHQHPVHIMRPPHTHTHTLPHHHLPSPQPGGPGSASASGPIKGILVSSPPTKVIPASSLSDYNGYKDTRSRDDALAIIRNRKVRIADGASLYQLCRSWLRNGFPDEVQPQYAEAMKSLPKPLPIQMVATHLPKRKGVAEEEEEEEEEEGEEEEDEAEDKEDEESVDQLLPQDLLRRHIKHAKKVRSRLREERLRRIARYKSRLALLLPPLVEQLRNDAAGRN